MTTSHARRRQLALAAPHGPYSSGVYPEVVHCRREHFVAVELANTSQSPDPAATAAHIAECSPEVIVADLDRIAALERALLDALDAVCDLDHRGAYIAERTRLHNIAKGTP